MFNYFFKSFSGSFFRTVGRFLAYSFIGFIIAYLLSKLGLYGVILHE